MCVNSVGFKKIRYDHVPSSVTIRESMVLYADGKLLDVIVYEITS